MKVEAQVTRQAIDVAAELHQRIAGRLARERADGGADRVRLCPAACTRELLEPLEILSFEVNLQWACHEDTRYAIMINASTRS